MLEYWHHSGERLISLSACKSIIFTKVAFSLFFTFPVLEAVMTPDVESFPASLVYRAAILGWWFSIRQTRPSHPSDTVHALLATQSLLHIYTFPNIVQKPGKISTSYLPLLGQKAISKDLVQGKNKNTHDDRFFCKTSQTIRSSCNVYKIGPQTSLKSLTMIRWDVTRICSSSAWVL